MVEIIKEGNDLLDLLPEELQAQAIIEIKDILLQIAKALNKPEKEVLIAFGLKLDALIETIKEGNNISYKHEVVRDGEGKALYLITSPIRARLKIAN